MGDGDEGSVWVSKDEKWLKEMTREGRERAAVEAGSLQ